MGSLSPTKGVGIFATLQFPADTLSVQSKRMSFLRLCTTQWRGSGIARQIGKSSPLHAPVSAPVEHLSKFTLMGPPGQLLEPASQVLQGHRSGLCLFCLHCCPGFL